MRTSSPDLTADVLGEYCFCGEEAIDALTRSEEYPTYNTYPLNQYVEYKSQQRSSLKREEEGKKFTLGDVFSMNPLHCLKQDPGAPFYT
jgi:hypothetical protein